jgi:hypothetical protein
MPDQPLDGEVISALLEEVADALPADGPQLTIVIAGGSLLALHGLRQTTADVDSVKRLDEELRKAVTTVAVRHDLDPAWLNDRSAAFAPTTLQEKDCPVLLQRGRLAVLGAPLSQVFLMKLYAARARDYDDLVVLWPRAGFRSPEEAASALAAAYPHAPDDPHLADYVRAIAEAAQDGSAPTGG